jgi:hypothetical protein
VKPFDEVAPSVLVDDFARWRAPGIAETPRAAEPLTFDVTLAASIG